MSESSTVRAGFREDFRTREILGWMGVAPGGGGAAGADLGKGGCGGCGSFGRVNFYSHGMQCQYVAADRIGRGPLLVRTGILVAKVLGSNTWLEGYLLALESRVCRKVLAKVSSLIVFCGWRD